MNSATFSSKQPRVRALIIAGFLFIIALLAWLAIQVVSVLPAAFSSLASLAEGLNQYKEAMVDYEPLSITAAPSEIVAGMPVTITWKKDDRPGTYIFSYSCQDDISVSVVTPAGQKPVACDTRYDLGDTDTLTFIPNSGKTGNFGYAISFMRGNDVGPIRIAEQNVPLAIQVVTEDPNPETDGQVLGESDSDETATSSEPTVTPPPTVVVEEIIYEIPTSNPNGVTDLFTKYIVVGDIKNNRFVAGTIEQGETGAIQFEVKNGGTKTSGVWTYKINLPDGTYESPRQLPLKPNERAVIAISFTAPRERTHTFTVKLDVDDYSDRNNQFSQKITFAK
jgi:hypothetical protein